VPFVKILPNRVETAQVESVVMVQLESGIVIFPERRT
jgi:hypothetical protein